jgi:hypothetical protein
VVPVPLHAGLVLGAEGVAGLVARDVDELAGPPEGGLLDLDGAREAAAAPAGTELGLGGPAEGAGQGTDHVDDVKGQVIVVVDCACVAGTNGSAPDSPSRLAVLDPCLQGSYAAEFPRSFIYESFGDGC